METDFRPNVSTNSAEFIYDNQIVVVNTEDISNYQKIGHGHFGSVYRVAIKESPDISIAIKVRSTSKQCNLAYKCFIYLFLIHLEQT